EAVHGGLKPALQIELPSCFICRTNDAKGERMARSEESLCYLTASEALAAFKARNPAIPTKSGLMVGLGETDDEIGAREKKLGAGAGLPAFRQEARAQPVERLRLFRA
ncbi:MAG TPA: hypothetical protein DEA50_13080, partial [Parvularcula sp.]|nr:hypothetical protein [Parvularcula sp.]